MPRCLGKICGGLQCGGLQWWGFTVFDHSEVRLSLLAFIDSRKKHEKVVLFIRRMQNVNQKYWRHRFGVWTPTHLSLRLIIEDPYSCLAVQGKYVGVYSAGVYGGGGLQSLAALECG